MCWLRFALVVISMICINGFGRSLSEHLPTPWRGGGGIVAGASVAAVGASSAAGRAATSSSSSTASPSASSAAAKHHGAAWRHARGARVCVGGGGARTGAILWDPSLHFVQHIAHAHKHSTLQCAWEQSLPPLLESPCFEKVLSYIVPTQRCFKLKVGPLPNALCK